MTKKKYVPEPVKGLGVDTRNGGFEEIFVGRRRYLAERVAACVRACEGIPTEALAAGYLRDLLNCPRDNIGRLLHILAKLKGEG